MHSYLTWAILSLAAAWAIWQLCVPEPVLPPLLLSLLLMVLGLLGGLRAGTDSATRFVKDLTRLNHVLAEQNRDLSEANHVLLKTTVAKEGDADELAGRDQS